VPTTDDTNPRPIVCVRFHRDDLAIVETAREIMGDGTLSSFVRTSAITLGKASASVDGAPPAAGRRSCELKGSRKRLPQGGLGPA
jgi:hypothetical protein